MRVHIIATGGAVMHNLAIALHKMGYQVTGSDDEIYDPAKSRLDRYGLLPKQYGWNTDNISDELDLVIVGMHAKKDNPELNKANELGLKIYSYPEFIYELSKDKKRVVIGGSHGKTSITSIILHVLQENNVPFDYLVGAQLEGFDTMVQVTDAPIIIMEGDEYLTSPLDPRPKFHLYHPHVALLSGIAWDHVNVFPTFENYCDQFDQFVSLIEPKGSLVWYQNDEHIDKILKENKSDINRLPYLAHPHRIENGLTILEENGNDYPIRLFGQHNMENIMGAKLVCQELGISSTDFLQALSNFDGANKRLDLLGKNDKTVVYKDFAHSPSKLKATVNAVKEQYPEQSLTACMELHTFSSLTKSFLTEYNGAMDNCDDAIVYINTKYFEIKNLPVISEEELIDGFNRKDLKVFFDSNELMQYLGEEKWEGKNLLIMTSGNFDNQDLQGFADKITA